MSAPAPGEARLDAHRGAGPNVGIGQIVASADPGVVISAPLAQVLRLGAQPARLRARMAGGAQMFAAGGGGPRLNIGERNTESIDL